jgi:hypothetical protein
LAALAGIGSSMHESLVERNAAVITSANTKDSSATGQNVDLDESYTIHEPSRRLSVFEDPLAAFAGIGNSMHESLVERNAPRVTSAKTKESLANVQNVDLDEPSSGLAIFEDNLVALAGIGSSMHASLSTSLAAIQSPPTSWGIVGVTTNEEVDKPGALPPPKKSVRFEDNAERCLTVTGEKSHSVLARQSGDSRRSPVSSQTKRGPTVSGKTLNTMRTLAKHPQGMEFVKSDVRGCQR